MKLKLCNNGLSVVGVNEKGMFISYSIEAEEYKQWLSEGNIPEPEFTAEELVAIELANKKQEALSYLVSTDWYVTRKLETGVEIPIEIFIKRAEARLIL